MVFGVAITPGVVTRYLSATCPRVHRSEHEYVYERNLQRIINEEGREREMRSLFRNVSRGQIAVLSLGEYYENLREFARARARSDGIISCCSKLCELIGEFMLR